MSVCNHLPRVDIQYFHSSIEGAAGELIGIMGMEPTVKDGLRVTHFSTPLPALRR